MIPHTIISEQDVSYANVKRTVIRVRLDVEEIPGKNEIGDLVDRLTENVPKDCDEYTVFGYLPDMETDGPAYVIGEWKGWYTSFRVNHGALMCTKWETESQE